jgi:TolB-like protein/lipoprotein NlpI
MHLGEHVHGDKVNTAARIYPLAEPGGICLSEDIFRQIQNQMEMPLVKLGKAELKNIQVPMAIYRMVMPWEKKRLPWSEQLRFKFRQKRGQQAALMVKTLLIAAILILAGLYVWQWMEGKKEDATVKSKKETSQAVSTHETLSLDKHRIAVLPFTNMSADAENEYFSDGMTEEMISQLSKMSGLRVIARTSVMQYKGKGKSIADIGRELNVGTVLEGSVRKAENQVRITTQLIDVQSQEYLWSQDYNRELKGVFAIQSDIAQRVAGALKVELLAGEKQRIEKKGTENLEAYNLYLKGIYYWNKHTKKDLQKSVEHFNQAIEKDPSYALAYAWLSEAYTTAIRSAYLPAKEFYPKAKVIAEKALQIDDTLSLAYVNLGKVRMYYDFDWLGAEKNYKRALSLNPNDAIAHALYGEYLTYRERVEEAITESKRVQELDPVSIIQATNPGRTLVLTRQYDLAIEHLQKVVEMDPNHFYPRFWLGNAYEGKGMYEEAISELRKAVDLSGGHAWVTAALGFAYAMSGKRDEALKVLEELKARSKQEYIPPGILSWVYAGLGEKDQVLDLLEQVYEERMDEMLMYLKIIPAFDFLRSDPRFIELMRKVGFE